MRERTIELRLTPFEFSIIKDAVEELLADYEPDWSEQSAMHEEVCRLAARLHTVEQTVIHPH